MQMEGNTCIITADLNSSITVERGNIVVDGANHTLQGPGISQNAIAITLMASNVTVENLHVTSWKAGVYGAFNNNTITNNVFTGNYQAVAIYADDYVVSENNISGSSDAAILIDTGATRPQGDNNLITQNQINKQQLGARHSEQQRNNNHGEQRNKQRCGTGSGNSKCECK